MKAIKVKNQVYELTGERGDFYVAKDNKGKVKVFAKIECEVVEIEKIEKKTYKKSATKTVSAEQLKKNTVNYIIDWLPSMIADYRARTFLTELSELDNSMVRDIANKALRGAELSNKQLYVLAINAVNNNINFDVNER